MFTESELVSAVGPLHDDEREKRIYNPSPLFDYFKPTGPPQPGTSSPSSIIIPSS